jgi:mono/diheme cytochrome c family protein
MNRRGAILLFCIAAMTVAVNGCRAKPPGKWETQIMTKVKHSITVHGKDEKNPVADNAANAEGGREAFSHYCAACHGLDGQNTGVPFADRMSPPVPPLNAKQVQSYTDGQLKWVIENGVSPSGMPGSNGILTEREIWSIVVFMRHLPEAGSLGEPAMYSGEQGSAQGATPSAQVR